MTLGRLLFEVADLAKNKPPQVFIATHSLEVVAHLVSLVERGLLDDADLNTLRTHLHQGTLTTSRFLPRKSGVGPRCSLMCGARWAQRESSCRDAAAAGRGEDPGSSDDA